MKLRILIIDEWMQWNDASENQVGAGTDQEPLKWVSKNHGNCSMTVCEDDFDIMQNDDRTQSVEE